MRKLAVLAGLLALAGLASPCLARGRRGDRPREGTLKVGDPAPAVELKKLDGKESVKLSSFKGKRPVVLVFGSYT